MAICRALGGTAGSAGLGGGAGCGRPVVAICRALGGTAGSAGLGGGAGCGRPIVAIGLTLGRATLRAGLGCGAGCGRPIVETLAKLEEEHIHSHLTRGSGVGIRRIVGIDNNLDLIASLHFNGIQVGISITPLVIAIDTGGQIVDHIHPATIAGNSDVQRAILGSDPGVVIALSTGSNISNIVTQNCVCGVHLVTLGIAQDHFVGVRFFLFVIDHERVRLHFPTVACLDLNKLIVGKQFHSAHAEITVVVFANRQNSVQSCAIAFLVPGKVQQDGVAFRTGSGVGGKADIAGFSVPVLQHNDHAVASLQLQDFYSNQESRIGSQGAIMDLIALCIIDQERSEPLFTQHVQRKQGILGSGPAKAILAGFHHAAGRNRSLIGFRGHITADNHLSRVLETAQRIGQLHLAGNGRIRHSHFKRRRIIEIHGIGVGDDIGLNAVDQQQHRCADPTGHNVCTHGHLHIHAGVIVAFIFQIYIDGIVRGALAQVSIESNRSCSIIGSANNYLDLITGSNLDYFHVNRIGLIAAVGLTIDTGGHIVDNIGPVVGVHGDCQQTGFGCGPEQFRGCACSYGNIVFAQYQRIAGRSGFTGGKACADRNACGRPRDTISIF